MNTAIPEWGRPLTNEELHAEMMADTFVGGSETTTNALSGGVRLLIEHPEQWHLLKSEPEKYLPVLVEEVLRLESPVQALFRTAAVDLTLHGVDIKAGSIISIRYGAANRDDRLFHNAEKFDLERSDYRQLVSFGHGVHHCLAPRSPGGSSCMVVGPSWTAWTTCTPRQLERFCNRPQLQPLTH